MFQFQNMKMCKHTMSIVSIIYQFHAMHQMSPTNDTILMEMYENVQE